MIDDVTDYEFMIIGKMITWINKLYSADTKSLLKILHNLHKIEELLDD